jgi:toxin CptA
MHRPPAVSHNVGRSLWHFGVIAVFAGLALLAATQLALFHSVWVARWAPFIALALCFSLALIGWARSPCGKLQWDGEHWLWSGFAETPVRQIAAVLDFQGLMLLKVTSELGDVAWLWLQGRMKNPQWRALRRAVVSSQTSQASSEGLSRKSSGAVAP